MDTAVITLIAAVGVLVVFLLGFMALVAKFYQKVDQGHAMIVNTMRAEPEVSFTGRLVIPILHRRETMDISLKTIEIERMGKEGLICKDNMRADIKVKFFVRVNKTRDDVLRVAQGIGCARASSQQTLEDLFSAKFSEALKTVGKAMDFVDLYEARDRFRDQIVRQIGDELSGYVLEDAAIDYLEQTPLEKLDPHNILDAQGIRKITELTAEQNVHTNELRRNEEMRIKKKDVETAEAVLELERQKAYAEANQQREIANTRAREEAESAKVAAEERSKSEIARLLADQQIAVQQENMKREAEVAEKNRQRAVAIEEERVTRARELEQVDREREVTLHRIEKEKAVEVQKKAIADVIRERIVVERTVAEQEEEIKNLRTLSDAERTKKSTIVLAEGAAEESFIAEVRKAMAEEQRAKHKAAEELTMAEAKLAIAGKAAEGKKREAEGIEAVEAASGLAAAKVAIAQADATEKEGLVAARLKIADAEAIAKHGSAEAEALRLKLEAEATGKQKHGVAEAEALRLKLEAEASGKQKHGEAEAHAIAVRFAAEAGGLKDKFEAMKAMSEETRAHEEQRMQLDYAHAVTMKGIDANQAIARDQAEVLAKALSVANIEIVGGDGAYFERFMRSLSLGKAIDGTVDKSALLSQALAEHKAGKRDLIADARELIAAIGGADALRDLSVANLAQRLGAKASDGGLLPGTGGNKD
ncbi:SPFH domain-containing protein [Tahibacter amnicola]|uniref:Band 7 domain-containing protein n=1 Tax=Tahibacter amnicola TaxID=2976241 RepID=A0ABY6BGS1_9GAMM|nr:hypothetical protein [Tahibacter amnicola]UXI68270.1 hypothetical protein N4264_01080 [Tahibacter amnicola]